MTQQPNQNYPQPGQGWGQQPQAQQPAPQWGQPAPQGAPQQPQWGQPQQQPAYGQPAPAPQWGQPAAGPSAGGGAVVAKAWALYAALGAAVVSVIMIFLPWAEIKLSGAGGLFDEDLTVTPFAFHSGGKSSGDGIFKVWGILIIVGAVVAVVGGGLVLATKNAQMAWVLVGGTAVTLVGAVAELIYLNGKLSDAKKEMLNAAADGANAGAKYSIGLSIGAYVAVVVAVAGVALAVLAALSAKGGASVASSASVYGGYGQPAQQAYSQPAAYGQPQQVQQPQQPQWGQPQPQAQPQWGQAPQQQPQWGAPAQDAPNPFADPANQPTQAVQQQYPPQPPQ